MKTYTFFTAAVAATFAAPVSAQTTREEVIDMLGAAGYTSVAIEKSLFGNLKFEAEGPNGEREVVLGKNGEILRDKTEKNDPDLDDDLEDDLDDDLDDDKDNDRDDD